MNSYLQKIAILCVIKALPDWMENSLSHGRLRVLMSRLQREADKELAKPNRLSDTEINMLAGKVKLWADSVGWDKKPKHTCTIVSFLIYLVVDFMPENAKLLELLEQIYDYFARVGRDPVQAGWAGTLSAERWSEIFG